MTDKIAQVILYLFAFVGMRHTVIIALRRLFKEETPRPKQEAKIIYPGKEKLR